MHTEVAVTSKLIQDGPDHKKIQCCSHLQTETGQYRQYLLPSHQLCLKDLKVPQQCFPQFPCCKLDTWRFYHFAERSAKSLGAKENTRPHSNDKIWCYSMWLLFRLDPHYFAAMSWSHEVIHIHKWDVWSRCPCPFLHSILFANSTGPNMTRIEFSCATMSTCGLLHHTR